MMSGLALVNTDGVTIRVSNKSQVTDWRLEWTNVEGHSRSLQLGNGLVEVMNLKGDTTPIEARGLMPGAFAMAKVPAPMSYSTQWSPSVWRSIVAVSPRTPS